MLPDWQLPPGVSRGLWHYAHAEAVAEGYDASLGTASLLNADCQFVQKQCPKPGRLLDLGCGTGRLLVPMAQRGHRVVGVDLSAPMLRLAGVKAEAAGVAIERVQANLVQLGCFDDACFDYAACLFSTLGMVVGEAARRQVVGHVHRVLRPGGVFVLHVHNRWFSFWDRAGRRWLLRDLWRRSGDRPMDPHGALAALTLHHFTRREAVTLLRQAGFHIDIVRPVSLRPDGRLPCPWWFGWLRSYGYLIAARK